MTRPLDTSQSPVQPLQDISVLELGDWVSASFATKILADLGAQVIKVERPSGDLSREYGPFPGDEPDPERSGLYLYLNTNKLGITMATGSPEAGDLLNRLASQVDLLVHNVPPVHADEIGLSYDLLKKHNDRLLMLEISPYGRTGPYAAYKGFEVNAAALGGVVMQLGLPGHPPLNPPLHIGHFQAGLTGAMAPMIALVTRDLTGVGQHIDVAESDSWATFHTGNGTVQWAVRRQANHALWQAGGRRAIPQHDPWMQGRRDSHAGDDQA